MALEFSIFELTCNAASVTPAHLQPQVRNVQEREGKPAVGETKPDHDQEGKKGIGNFETHIANNDIQSDEHSQTNEKNKHKYAENKRKRKDGA